MKGIARNCLEFVHAKTLISLCCASSEIKMSQADENVDEDARQSKS